MGRATFPCDYCNKVWPGKTLLQSHINSRHPGEALAQPPKACRFDGCNRKFADSPNLRRHEEACDFGDQDRLVPWHACPAVGCEGGSRRPDNAKRHIKACSKVTNNTTKPVLSKVTDAEAKVKERAAKAETSEQRRANKAATPHGHEAEQNQGPRDPPPAANQPALPTPPSTPPTPILPFGTVVRSHNDNSEAQPQIFVDPVLAPYLEQEDAETANMPLFNTEAVPQNPEDSLLAWLLEPLPAELDAAGMPQPHDHQWLAQHDIYSDQDMPDVDLNALYVQTYPEPEYVHLAEEGTQSLPDQQ